MSASHSTQIPALKNKVQQKNPFETLAGGGASIAKSIEAQKKAYEAQIAALENNNKPSDKNETKAVINPEFQTVFNYVTHAENVDRPKQIEEISTLIQEIKHEVKDLKAKSAGLNAEVNKIEKVAMEALPEKPGVYHVRYLEIMLQFLRDIRTRVSEAHIWLSAMNSKKKKRGSVLGGGHKKANVAQEESSAHNSVQ